MIEENQLKRFHKLLQRQLKRATLPTGDVDCLSFFTMISEAYEESEKDLDMTHRSVTLMSEELLNANKSLHQQAEELRVSQERYVLASQGTNDGLWDYDCLKNTLFCSSRWKEMIGYSEDDSFITLDHWLDLVHVEDRLQMEEAFKFLDSDRICIEYRMKKKNGDFLWVLTRGITARDSYGQPSRVVGSQTDVSDRKKSELDLFHAAFYDKLTGLPNRALFLDRLQQILQRFKRLGESPAGLLFLDLDRFKIVNDSLGHEAGDELLIQVSKRLEKAIRPGDTVARLGGDEFTVILSEIEDESHAMGIANRIIQDVSQPYTILNHKVSISASIGVTLIDERSADFQLLLRNADLAMYEAKNKGKGRAEVYAKEHFKNVYTKMQLEQDLQSAIEKDELVLYYQPIIDLKNGRVSSLEALIRWNHPTRGLLGPGEFIPIAEETGLILPIGHIVLGSVCRQLKKWRRSFPHFPSVALNVSGIQLVSEQHIQEMHKVLDQNDFPPGSLKIEVTESMLLANSDHMRDVLQGFKSKGVDLCIDDFGTGYSSLSYLHKFPFDFLKIDRSFVSQETSDNRLVKSILSLAQDLNLKTIAEGIETQPEYETLKNMGCDFGQGYFFAKPMPAVEISVLFANKRHIFKATA